LLEKYSTTLKINNIIPPKCSVYGGGVQRVLVEKPVKKNHWGDPGVDGRIILE
jgi:hypothetical protein